MKTNFTKEQIKTAIESFDTKKFNDPERLYESLKHHINKDDPGKISIEGQLNTILELSMSFTVEFVYSVLSKILVEDTEDTEDIKSE